MRLLLSILFNYTLKSVLSNIEFMYEKGISQYISIADRNEMCCYMFIYYYMCIDCL